MPLEQTSEPYLNINEPALYDTSVEKISYIVTEPPASRKLNDYGEITLTINQTADWVLPSEGYIYIEGDLLMWDPTTSTYIRIKPNDPGTYPTTGLVNNAMMYLFSSARYSLNSVEIESFNYPGYVTTIKGLLTLPKSFSGLDQCWDIDTHDGETVGDEIFYPVGSFTYNDMHTAAAKPTDVEYRSIMRLYIDRFNIVNSMDIANLTDAELPCAGANPTQAEIIAGFHKIVEKVNNAVFVNINGFDDTKVPGDTTVIIRGAMNYLVDLINKSLVYYIHPFKVNTGYRARRETLFSPFEQDANSIGSFSYRIPLSFIFNFCEQYNKVMYNCKHEITLVRGGDDEAIYKYSKAQKCKINLNMIKLYMPKIKPSLTWEAVLNKQIQNEVLVDMAFINKKIEVFNITPGTTSESVYLSYSGGVEKPRFIVAAFQAIMNNYSAQDVNHGTFNDVYHADSRIDVNRVDLYINGDSYSTNDYYNNFSLHKAGRWYNEFKKFRDQYYSKDGTSCVDYDSFCNLHRIYVFDISKQVETITGGVSNVKLDFKFNLPVSNNSTTKVYCLTFYDRTWQLSSDGTKQFIVK